MWPILPKHIRQQVLQPKPHPQQQQQQQQQAIPVVYNGLILPIEFASLVPHEQQQPLMVHVLQMNGARLPGCNLETFHLRHLLQHHYLHH